MPNILGVSKYITQVQSVIPWWRNIFINGNFGIWQRGTSSSQISTSRQYKSDRFYVYNTAGTLSTIQAVFNPVFLPINGLSRSSIRLNGATGTTDVFVGQRIESVNAYDLRRHSFLAFSAWVYNSTGSAFTPSLSYRSPAGVDNYASMNTENIIGLQSCVSGGLTEVKCILDMSLVSDVQYGLQVEIKIPSGSLTNGKTVYLSQFMLNPGNEYAPFMMAAGWDTSEELSKCQRYFEKREGLLGSGRFSASSCDINSTFLNTKRIIPVYAQVGNIYTNDGTTQFSTTFTLMGISSLTNYGLTGAVVSTAGKGATAYTGTVDSSDFVTFDSEI